MSQQSSGKINLTFSQAMKMLLPWIKERVLDQVKAVWLIVVYLVFFQTVVLGMPIVDASIIAMGLVLVIAGLTFFMEGLMLGLMPLGEVVGVKLPQKAHLVVILLFSIGLGFLATLAEPAIGVLKAAGSSVRPWEAPLLYHLLNDASGILVNSVGLGVGVAVMFGMLRFIYNWSLKPFIYILVGGLSVVTFMLCTASPNFLHLAGLAWDCGAVTTGPVTVPLVLALGIGISRMVGDGEGGGGGFGVVTLASLFPIITVLSLGGFFMSDVPQPVYKTDAQGIELTNSTGKKIANPDKFYENALAQNLFEKNTEDEEKVEIAEKLAAMEGEITGKDRLNLYILKYFKEDPARRGEFNEATLASIDSAKANERVSYLLGMDSVQKTYLVMFRDNMKMGLQAIGLLGIPMLLVLFFVLREKLPKADETFLGLAFAVVGMGIFSMGIELGLTKLGDQIGSKVPAAFKNVSLDKSAEIKIDGFNPEVVQKSTTADGKVEEFFVVNDNGNYKTVPYQNENLKGQTYSFLPTIGPLFGEEGGVTGILVVLIFAFILGYGATLAEPALNALGVTVEEITVGTFKKSLLMQAVALGVGFGIAFGVAKIMFNIPLIWMCGPPYILLLIITKLSTEEFVNIGWDSAGVTTGPITVPLVLAMGLGIGGQVGVVEGFGILSMASVCPILSVLSVGMVVTAKRKAALQSAGGEDSQTDSAAA
jgi:hypothetical protein